MELTRGNEETTSVQCIRRLGDFRSILEANRRTDRIFWSKDWDQRVSIEAYSSCWIWTGGTDSKGYATTPHAGNPSIFAFRTLYELIIGGIPSRRDLHHRCEIVQCINPWHGEPLTRAEHRKHHHEEACRRGHKRTRENTYIDEE